MIIQDLIQNNSSKEKIATDLSYVVDEEENHVTDVSINNQDNKGDSNSKKQIHTVALTGYVSRKTNSKKRKSSLSKEKENKMNGITAATCKRQLRKSADYFSSRSNSTRLPPRLSTSKDKNNGTKKHRRSTSTGKIKSKGGS